MTGRAVRILKWGGLSVFSLVALALVFYVYVVVTFDTETLPEGYGRVGSLLYAGDHEKQPLIVGLGGAEGGNSWVRPLYKPIRDSLLQQGYAVLALAYFGGWDAPTDLDRISVEGVYAAIMEAARDPRVNENCIAVIGGSKGAELALLLGSHYPDIKAVVGIAPSHVVFPAHTIAMNTSSFALNGQPLPFVPMTWSAVPALLKRDLRAAYDAMLTNEEAVSRAAIAVENINGPLLLLSATQDEFWPSTEMAESIVDRLRRGGFQFAAEHVDIEGGHDSQRLVDAFDLVYPFLAEHVLRGSEGGCPR